MTIRGYPATVVIEIELKDGTFRVPVGDLAAVEEGEIPVLRLPMGHKLQDRVNFAVIGTQRAGWR